MDERRQLPRWEIKKQAKVWMPQTQSFVLCTIEDLHLKGMSMSFDKKLPDQELPLKMSFAIGNEFDMIKVEAAVPWNKHEDGRYLYGFSFSRIDDRDKDRLYQYIHTNCADQLRNRWYGV